MPDPYIAGEAAAFVGTLTAALVSAVALLGTVSLCFAWAGRKVRGVL